MSHPAKVDGDLMPDPVTPPARTESVNGDEFFDGNGGPPPRLGDPVPNVTGHQPFGPSGIAVVGVSEVKPPPSGDPFIGQKDARGIEWSPVKFRLKDGRPHIDSLGRFVPLGIGRTETTAPAGPGAPARPSPGVSTLPLDDPVVVDEPLEALTVEIGADVAIGLIQTALIMVGEEEGEMTPLECKMIRGPMVRVLAKYHLGDKMTPELELASVVAALVMRRLKKPKTQSWFLARLAWLRAWWNARRLKRAVVDAVPS